MNRKQFLIAALVAVALLTVVFNAISIFTTQGAAIKEIIIYRRASRLIRAVHNRFIEPEEWWQSDWIFIDGYSKMTILIFHPYLKTSKFRIWAKSDSTYFLVEEQDHSINRDTWLKTYDVMNRYIRFAYKHYGPLAGGLTIELYLMA